MNKFICPRCHLNTHIRTHFKRHLTRKNICKPLHKDVPIKSIAESYGIDIPSTENNIVSQNVSQNKYQSHSIAESQSITNCKYCNKSFTSANNCYRHQKHYCKYKKKEITITQDEIEKMKRKIKEEVQKEVEEKYEVIADQRAQKMVLSLVDKLTPNQTTNQTNNHTNSHNNIVQNNNIQNNNNTHLKINNFGEE